MPWMPPYVRDSCVDRTIELLRRIDPDNGFDFDLSKRVYRNDAPIYDRKPDAVQFVQRVERIVGEKFGKLERELLGNVGFITKPRDNDFDGAGARMIGTIELALMQYGLPTAGGNVQVRVWPDGSTQESDGEDGGIFWIKLVGSALNLTKSTNKAVIGQVDVRLIYKTSKKDPRFV